MPNLYSSTSTASVPPNLHGELNAFKQEKTALSGRSNNMSDEEEGSFQERSFRSRHDRSLSPDHRRGPRNYHSHQQQQHARSVRNYPNRPPFGRRPPIPMGIPTQKSECKLIIERIPAEYCTISQVNEYFQKFGTVVNITVQPEFQRARIEYANKAEANAAYTSPDVIFNNRFVKVFWDNDILPPPPPPHFPHPRHSSSTISPASIPSQNQSMPKRRTPSIEGNIQNELVAKKQEALKGMLELQKQKHELLMKYISEQKELLQKLESKELDESERNAIMKTLANIDQIISTLKVNTSESNTSSAAVPVSNPVMRGGPRFGRGAAFASRSAHRLDLRPTSFLLKPVPSRVGSTVESIKSLFSGHGGISNINIIDSNALITFTRRLDAEKAFSYISQVDLGEPFQVEWSSSQSNTTNTTSPAPAAIEQVESMNAPLLSDHIPFEDVEMTSADHQ